MYYLFRQTIRLLNRQLLFIEHIDNLINVCNSVLLTNVLDLTMCYLRPRAISSYEPFCCFIDCLQNMYHVIKRRKQVSVVQHQIVLYFLLGVVVLFYTNMKDRLTVLLISSINIAIRNPLSLIYIRPTLPLSLTICSCLNLLYSHSV